MKTNELPNKGCAIEYVYFIYFGFVSVLVLVQDIYSFTSALVPVIFSSSLAILFHFFLFLIQSLNSALSIVNSGYYHDRNVFFMKVKITNRLVDEIWKCGPETRVDVSVNQETKCAYALHILLYGYVSVLCMTVCMRLLRLRNLICFVSISQFHFYKYVFSMY